MIKKAFLLQYARPVLRQATVTNAFFYLGVLALIYGVWMIYRPAGWIVGGLLFMGLSVASEIYGGRHPRS